MVSKVLGGPTFRGGFFFFFLKGKKQEKKKIIGFWPQRGIKKPWPLKLWKKSLWKLGAPPRKKTKKTPGGPKKPGPFFAQPNKKLEKKKGFFYECFLKEPRENFKKEKQNKSVNFPRKTLGNNRFGLKTFFEKKSPKSFLNKPFGPFQKNFGV